MLLNDVILFCHVSCEAIRDSCLKEVFEILSEVFSAVLLWEVLFSQCTRHQMVLTVSFCLWETAVQRLNGTKLLPRRFLLWPLNLRMWSCVWDRQTDILLEEEPGRRQLSIFPFFLSSSLWHCHLCFTSTSCVNMTWLGQTSFLQTNEKTKLNLIFWCLTPPGNKFQS